jgi:hypothetical protein
VGHPDTQVAVTTEVGLPPGPSNDDVEWDDFDSDAYFTHNYGRLRSDDRQIIKIVTDFFESAGPARWPARAIDVGSGANLYPALSMLPFSTSVTLFERAAANREWLEHQLDHPYGQWWQFWAAMSGGRPEYERIMKPLDVLADRAEVVKGNVFTLSPDQFDIGTMFFVAESITTKIEEFRRATQHFVRSLMPRAPFAAAFMRDSSGYVVGNRHFPACSINEQDVRECLAEIAVIKDIQVVESDDLRDGYLGMIVATGRKR